MAGTACAVLPSRARRMAEWAVIGRLACAGLGCIGCALERAGAPTNDLDATIS